MWWSKGQRGCCEAVGGKTMMLVMWVMHQAIFDIGHTFIQYQDYYTLGG